MEEGAVDDDDLVALQETLHRARPRWRARGLLALVAAGLTVVVLIHVLDSSRRPEIATSALDAPDTQRVATTGPSMPPTTTIDRATTTTTSTTIITASTTSTSSLDHASADPPLPVTTSTPRPTAPPVLTTTTTVDPHPWAPQRVEFFQADHWDHQVQLLAVNVVGIFDHYVLDFGDGESMVFESPSPFCNPGYDATAGWTHDYTQDGVYTATVTVYGSDDCDTAPASYRPTVATTLVTSPLPGG